MPFVNCRQTSGYVTDGASDTYSLGNETSSTTRNGITFQWDGAVSARNRSTGVDARLAGIVFFNGTVQREITITLPSTGEYDIRIAVGDATAIQTDQHVEIYDNTTLIATVAKSGTLLAGHFLDAAGTDHSTAADWVSSNAAVNHTFTSTSLRVVLGDGVTSTNVALATVGYEAAGGGGGSTVPALYYHQMAQAAGGH